jgi:hypothetical protein
VIGVLDPTTEMLAPRCRACPAANRSGTPDNPMVMHREFDRWHGTEVVACLPVTRGATFLRGSWFSDAIDYRRDRTGD